MQKKLIAAAVAGLIAVPALAQTNVTISGRFAAGWESYKLSDCTTGFSCRSESRVSEQSSRLIFNVVEDLGGGLSAWGQLDYRGALDLGGLANSGNSGVGLMHKNWGKFTIGRWDVHYGEIDGAIGGNRAGSLQTLLGNGLMSQVNGVNIANTTRTPNILMWDSPNWNGFTGRLAYSTNIAGNEGSGVSVSGTGNPGNGYAWTGTLRYNNGPWTAGYSYWKANSESGVTGAAMADQRSHRAWLGYTFAMGLKVGIAWDRSQVDAGFRDVASTTFRRSAWMLPVSYEFGPHKVYASYARAGDMTNTPTVQTGAHAWNIGYDYAFSKRTSAGVYYTKYNNKEAGFYDMFAIGANGATATALGEDARQIYIGLAHNF
jgi:predicted porin